MFNFFLRLLVYIMWLGLGLGLLKLTDVWDPAGIILIVLWLPLTPLVYLVMNDGNPGGFNICSGKPDE